MNDKNITLFIELEWCDEPDNYSLVSVLSGHNRIKDIIYLSKNYIEHIMPIDIVRKRKEELIPIGSLQFIKKFYLQVYRTQNILSFEIPKILWHRNDLIGRNYEVISGNQILHWYPDATGNYCVKDVSDIKGYFHMGPLDDEETVKYITKYQNHQFSISEEIPNVESEWRVYSYVGKITNVCNYDGNPLVFPETQSLELLNNLLYNYLQMSFSFDVLVTDSSTYLLEVHPHICLGYYYQLTKWDSDDILNAILQGHCGIITGLRVW